LTVDVFAAYSRANGGETATAAGQLQFNGDGQVIGVLVNKQLQRFGEFEQKIGIGLDLRLFLNDCEILGLPPGACGSAGESVSVNPLSLAYTARKGGRTPAGFSFGLSQNLGLLGRNGSAANFEAVRPGAPKHYWLGRAGGFATMTLPQQWKLHGRISGQFTPDALVPGEQFGIAGANTVRGYLEREVVGDQGLAGSVELYAPEFVEPFGTPQSMLQLLAFADAGKVWNHESTPCVGAQSSCPLASFGVGLRWELHSLQVRIDLAHALKNGNSTSAGENRASFLATLNF
jgi:hemolysin activation/secretion protein